MPRSIRVRPVCLLILATLFVALSSQTSHLSANDGGGLTAASRSGAPPSRGRISQDLLDLAGWAERLPASASLEQALTSHLAATNSAIASVEDRVIIEFVVKGDGAAVLRQLEKLGLTDATRFGRVISGALPVRAVSVLTTMDGIISAAPPLPQLHTGAADSQGDVAQRSNLARTLHSVTGAGVTVGVLSDSYDCLGGAAADIAGGDLPDDVVVLAELSNCTNASDEGRAMLQIVHDVAPEADLMFHTAFESRADFAQGIIDLANAGADVIVDDVSYAGELMFQDGIIAQAVDEVVAAGVAYFSSAGNNARNAYEAAYADDGTPVNLGSIPYLGSHDFDPGPGVDTCLSVAVPANGSLQVIMQWDEPGASAGGTGAQSDLDIFIYGDPACSSPGSPITAGTTIDIDGDPFEITGAIINGFSETAFAGIQVGRFSSAAPTVLKLQLWASDASFDEHQTNSGTIYGHANAAGAETVGAAFYMETPAFDQSPPLLEPFSSAGPMPVWFDTAGNRLTSPDIRQKPEIVAPDGANTTFFSSPDPESDGFPNFFGTSAAAPHAAAAAALMLEINPALTPAELYEALESTAVDMDAPGADDDTGLGLIDVEAAVDLAGNEPPVFGFTGPFNIDENSSEGMVIGTVTVTDGNGDSLTFAETADGASAGVFAIDPVTGEITVQDPAALNRESVESFIYDIEVADDWAVVSAQVTINLDGVNDNVPEFDVTGPFSILENSPAGTMVGTVTVTDLDVGPVDVLTFTEDPEGTAADIFSIDPSTGEITVEDETALDREAVDSFSYGIQVSDGVSTVTATVAIELDGVNDNPPVTDGQTVETGEASPLLITLTATDTDIDPSDTLTFTIVTPPSSGSLSEITPVNATSASVTYTPDPGFTGADSFTFQVSDGATTDGPAAVDITVVPNVPPTFTGTGPFAIDENAEAGTVVDTVAAVDSDADPEDAPLSFAETPGGAGEGTFAIDPDTGAITVEDPAGLDREAGESVSYDIEVSDGLSTVTTTVTVELNGINDNSPAFTFSGPFTLLENSPSGTPVGTVTAEDADIDPAQTLTFAEVSGGEGGSTFAIDSVTGAITVQDPAALDREVRASLSYDITVSDGESTSPVTVTIALDGENDNEPVPDVTGPFEIDENSPPGTPVGTVTASDADTGPADTLSFAEAAAPGADTFEIDAATGEITVEDPSALDRELAASLAYQILVSDGNSTVPATVTVNLNGVNDNAPAFAFSGPFSVLENSPAGTLIDTVTATDADIDPEDTLSFAEMPGAAVDTFDIDPVTGEITVQDTAALNREAAESLGYDIVVSDGINASSVTVTVNLDGVNDANPVFTSTGPFTIDENSPAPTVVGTVTSEDIDTDPQDTLTFAEIPDGTFAETFAIDPATGEITVQDPAELDREAVESLTYDIEVSDGTHMAQATVTINLAGVNDNAPGAEGQQVSLLQGASVVITLTGSDTDVGPADTLTFLIGAGPAFGSLSPGSTSATVTYTPDPAYFGPDSFEFTVNDGENDSSAVTVSIEVVENLPPELTFTGPFAVAENSPAGTSVGTVTATDPDDVMIAFAETPGGAGTDTFAIDPDTGEITVQDPAALDREVSESLSYDIEVFDGLNTVLTTVAINLTGLNDVTPVFTSSGPFTIAENSGAGTVVGTVTAGDGDTGPADGLVFSEKEGVAGAETFEIDPATGEITVESTAALDRETVAALTYEIEVFDGLNTTESTVTINLDGVNDNVPEFDVTGPFSIEENSHEDTVVGTVTATDLDVGPEDVLTFAEVSEGAGESVFAINPSTGEITVEDETALDREAVDSFSYGIQVSDGVSTVAATVAIELDGVNDNAPVADARSAAVAQDLEVVITLTATDADVDPSDTLTFTIVTPPSSGSLSEITPVNATSASVTYTPDPGFTGADSFTFQVSDGATTDGPAAVDITVIPNGPPQFTFTGPFTVEENSAQGTPVGTVTATDPEDETREFSETAGGDGAETFAIDPDTGAITVEDPAGLDREAGESVSYDIEVSDGLSTVTTTVTVELNGINDNSPAFTFSGPFTLLENSPSGTPVGTVTAEDADIDPAQPLTFAEVSGGEGESTFAIDSTTGEITVQDPAALDREVRASLSYDITVSDGESTSPVTVTIALDGENDNEPDFILTGPFNILEEPDNGARVGTVTANDVDVDPDEPISFAETGEGDGAPVFSIDPENGWVEVEDPSALDRESVESYLYEIEVSDGVNTDTVTLTINIQGFNDETPVASAQSVTVTEGGAATITLTGTDADIDPADTLTFSIDTGPLNGALSAVTPGNGTSATVAYTPDPGFTGADSFQFTVNDGVHDSPAATVTVSVQPQPTGGGGGGGGFTPQPTPAPAPPPGPSAPSVPLSVTAVPGDGSVTISWQPPASDGGALVTGYRILNLSSGQSQIVPAPALDVVISGLDNGTAYSFQVQAVNSAGPGASVVAGPVTPSGPPGAPSDVQAVLNPDNTVTLTWAAPETDGGSAVTGYVISLLDGTELVSVDEGDVLTAEITGLAPGDTYSFVVSAVNAAGVGEPSAPAGPVTLPAVSPAPEDAPSEDALFITQESETTSALQDAVSASFGDEVTVPDRPIVFDTRDGAQSILIELESAGGALSLPDEFNVVSEQLTVQTGSPGRAAFSIRIGDGLAITGAAALSIQSNGMVLDINQSVLEYSPAVSGNAGALSSVNFLAVLMRLPPDAALSAVFSTDVPQEIAGTVLLAGASGEGGVISNLLTDVAGVVTVTETGLSDLDLGANTVSMGVSAQWYEQQTGQGKSVVITKVSDDGDVFTELAGCHRSGDEYVCLATFSGAAGGFSKFVLAGLTALDQPSPTATPAPTTPVATAEPASTPAGGAQQPSVNAITPTPAPSPLPEPTVITPLDMPMSDDAGFPLWGWVVVGAFGLIGARAAWYVFARGRS